MTKLGELVEVWECSDSRPPDADTTMIRRIGDMESVGKVVEKKDRDDISSLSNYLCIKPRNNNELVPDYLYYSMQYTHLQGHWRRVGTPHANSKYKIRVSDVKQIDVRRV